MLQIIALLIIYNTIAISIATSNAPEWVKAGIQILNIIVLLEVLTNWPTV